MNKKALWLVVAAAMVMALCSSTVMAAEKTVRFWTWWTVKTEDLDKMSKAIGYKVEYQQLDWGEFQQKLVVGVMGGESPDLIYIDPSWFDDFASKGTLMDLKPYITKDKSAMWKDIFPAAMDLWDVNGKQFGLPNTVSPSLFWYNKDMFRKAGIPELDDNFSWAQWLAYSKKLSIDVDGDGRKDQYGFMNWWYSFNNLIWSNGGEIFKNGQIAFDSKEVREALTFYKQFKDLDIINDWDQLAHKGHSQHPDTAWTAGLIGMAPGGDWVGPTTVRDEKGDWRFDVGVALEPMSPKGGRAALLRGNSLGIPVTAKNPDGAFALAKYLLGDESQTQGAIDGQMPSRISIATKSYLPKDKYPYSKDTIIKSLSYQRGPDKGVNWSQSFEIWNSPVKTAFNAYIGGSLPLEAAIEQAKKQTPPLMKPAK